MSKNNDIPSVLKSRINILAGDEDISAPIGSTFEIFLKKT